jgi:hypothetical protein
MGRGNSRFLVFVVGLLDLSVPLEGWEKRSFPAGFLSLLFRAVLYC